jgi:hypothetical protein
MERNGTTLPLPYCKHNAIEGNLKRGNFYFLTVRNINMIAVNLSRQRNTNAALCTKLVT